MTTEQPTALESAPGAIPTDALPAAPQTPAALLPILENAPASDLREVLLESLFAAEAASLGLLTSPAGPYSTLAPDSPAGGTPLSEDGDLNVSTDSPAPSNFSGSASGGASAASSSAASGGSAAIFATLLLVGLAALCLGKLALASNRLQLEPYIAISERPG